MEIPRGRRITDSRENKVSFYLKALEASLLALVLLLPLVLTTKAGNANYPKTTLFNLILIILVSCWLLERVKSNRWTMVRSPLYLPILGVLGIGFISTLMNAYKYAALAEMLRQSSYAAFFVVILNSVRERRQFERLLKVILAGAILPCLYGAIQYLHLDWIEWSPEPSWMRLLGSFGNATFFAAYLATLLPMGIALSIAPRDRENSSRESLVIGLLVTLMAFCLIFTYARASWLAFLFVVLVQGVMSASLLKGGKRLKMLIPALGLAAVLGLGLILPGTFSLFQRTKSAFTADPSNIQRAIIWQGAINIFHKHPILGTGPGTFGLYLPENQSPKFFRTGNFVITDHAHNEFLEVASETGILGLAAFLWLLATYYWFGFKGLKEVKDARSRLIMVGLMGGVGAFLICNQAGVTMRWTSGAVFYWLFLALTGCIRAIALREATEQQGIKESKKERREGPPAGGQQKAIPLWARWGLYLLICILAVYGVFGNLRLLACEFYLRQADLLLDAKMYPEARQKYEQVVSLNPYSPPAYYKLGHIYDAMGEPDRSIKSYQKIIQFYPDYARTHYNLGVVYSSKGDLKEAERELKLAVKLDDLPSSHLQLGLVEAKKGNLSEAREDIYGAIKEDDSLDGAEVHLNLGSAYQAANKLPEAEEEYEKALALNPNDYRIHTNLGTVYFESGKHDKAIEHYQAAVRLNPQDIVAYANLASLYPEVGNNEKAREMWGKVSELASADSELGKKAREMLSKGGR